MNVQIFLDGLRGFRIHFCFKNKLFTYFWGYSSSKNEASVVGRPPSRCFKCFDVEHLAKECSLFR